MNPTSDSSILPRGLRRTVHYHLGKDQSVYYFSVYDQQTLVGTVYLHDIDLQTGDALIGYHLFHAQDRGKGMGTKMLSLLQQYVVNETAIKRLIIITRYDNGASRGIALKCGFSELGGAWEDPENLVVYGWSVTRA